MSNTDTTSPVKRTYSDAGRSAADKAHNDTNSCTVNALANSTGWDWNLCHDIAAQSGRKRGKGHWPQFVLKTAGHFGCRSRKLTRIRKNHSWTVQKFVKLNPTGSFYVASSRHAFAIVDGVVKDWQHNGDLVRIVEAYRIVQATYNGRKVEVPVHKPKPRPWLRGPRVEYTIRLKDKDGDAYDVHYYSSREEAVRDAKTWALSDNGEDPYEIEVERVTIGSYDWKTIYERRFEPAALAAA